MKFTFSKLIVVMSLIVTVGCASSASKEGKSPASNTNAPNELKKDSTKTDPSKKKDTYACDDGASLMFKEGALDIEGNDLSVYTGRDKEKKTLCEVLASTGKKSGIFQFAGFTCISCMDEAIELQKFVKSNKGSDVAHIVVFTDLFEDATDENFKTFVDQYAPDATVVYDEAKLWKYWSKDPSLPNRATIMSMNMNAEGHILNDGGEYVDMTKIEQIAIDLAKKIK